MPDALIWKPFKRQEEFLSLPDTIDEALYGGAAGGGKSEVLILFPIVRGFYNHPRFKGIIFRRTYPELESEIIIRSKIWYPSTGAKYNEEKKRWTFPSGAIMQFGHVEYERDVQNYDTAEYNYMAFDELTSFTERQYKYLAYSRCRSSSRELPALVRAGTNPGNVGHAWVRKHFVEPAPQKTIIVDKLSKLKRIFIQSKADDNPHLDIKYVSHLQMLPEADRRAKLDGDWYTYEGQVFDDWRELPIPGEPPNAVHVIEPIRIPDWWTRILAVDWGYSAMVCALWGALSPDRRIYIYREFTTKKEKISIWAPEIRLLNGNDKITSPVICRSASQNRGDDESILEQVRRHTGFNFGLSDSGRVSGKLTLQEYLRWRPRKSAPPRSLDEFDSEEAQSILRNLGIDAYEKYHRQFQAEPEEKNLPKLQVFSTCKTLIYTIPLCVYAKSDNISGKPAEDVAEFDGDDPYDTVRYLLMEADRLSTQELEVKHRHQTDLASVLDEFEKSGDWTRFHRRMEYLERANPVQRAVRRHHRARK